MNEIYAIDSARISHREYWWGTQSPLVLLGWMAKWLRLRIPGSTDDPNVESTSPWVVDALPADVLERFRPLAGELAALGFYDVAYHSIRDPGTQTTIYWATFLHGSGTHFARIHQRLWSQSQKVSRALFPMFFTGFTDGTFLVSSSGKPDMATPAAVRMNRMPRAATGKLWAAHQQLAATFGAQKMPVRVASVEEALTATERHHVLLRDYHLARGVFRSRTAEEQSKAGAYAASLAQAQADGLQHAEVMAELDRLQAHKPGWGNALLLLLFSAIGFVAAGAAQWDWKFTLWIIPVLLFHEAGHWVAMRIFGYRNLRMFFIPFFGAAVTGRHWNVPGWKKVLVSLAGPVPGVVLGSILGVVALITRLSWLNEAAFMLVIVNGFNLLPILPLDGGHVLQATLFCRNRWLDIAFRVIAIGVLLLLGIFGLGPFFYFISFALAISLPVAFKTAKVVDAMRRAPQLPPPLDQDRIPTETAQAIISALKVEQPKGVANKILAQQALGVFETLNAKPPNVLATLGLLALHGGTFFVAIVFCFLLILGKHGGGLGNVLSTAMRQPQHQVQCDQPAQTWRGAEAVAVASRNLLVTTFKKRDAAHGAFVSLTNRLPATACLSLFGDSLLLALPAGDDAARELWFRQLQLQSTNGFVVLSNRPVTISLMFVAATEAGATNLEQELKAYAAAPGTHLLAPWSPGARAADRAKWRAARLVWLRLDQGALDYWSDPATKAINKRITAARRRGAMAEATRLTTERDELVKNLEAKSREAVRVELAGSDTAALVDLHAKFSTLSYTNRAERSALLRQIAAPLGEVPFVGDQPAPAAAASGAMIALVNRTGLIFELTWCSLPDPQTSLPLILDWLCDQKCTNIKYDFQDFGGGLGDMDELME